MVIIKLRDSKPPWLSDKSFTDISVGIFGNNLVQNIGEKGMTGPKNPTTMKGPTGQPGNTINQCILSLRISGGFIYYSWNDKTKTI